MKISWKKIITVCLLILFVIFAIQYSNIVNTIKNIWQYTSNADHDLVSIILNAFVAAVGFLAIFISVQTDKKIKRYEYIADYNFHFLTSNPFFQVERCLETCFQKYKYLDSVKRDEMIELCGSVFFPDCNIKLDLDTNNLNGDYSWKYKLVEENDHINRVKTEYQNIINYLVYLESFTPLLLNKQLQYKDVDDVFGYRFFIAVNNPFIQDSELINDWKYYRGCIKIYKKWAKYRKGKDIDIPLCQFDLQNQLECIAKNDKELYSFLHPIRSKRDQFWEN